MPNYKTSWGDNWGGLTENWLFARPSCRRFIKITSKCSMKKEEEVIVTLQPLDVDMMFTYGVICTAVAGRGDYFYS